MSTGRLAWITIVTFMFPGFGQGLVSWRWMALWVSLGVLAVAGNLVTVWFVFASLAVHVASAIDALVRLRRASRRPPENLPPARADGRATPRQWSWATPAIAIVIGAIALGVGRMSLEAFQAPSTSMAPTLQLGDHFLIDKLTVHWRPPARGEVIAFWQPCEHDHTYIKRVVAIAGDTVEVRCAVLYVNGAAVPSALVDGPCSYNDGDETGRMFARSCSRYRETLGGHTYDVLHDPDRPQRDDRQRRGQLDPVDSKDFPSRVTHALPSCATQGWGRAAPVTAQPTGTVIMDKPDAGPCEPHLHFVVPADSLFVMGDNRPNSNDSRYWGVVPLPSVIGRLIGIYLPPGRIGAVD